MPASSGECTLQLESFLEHSAGMVTPDKTARSSAVSSVSRMAKSEVQVGRLEQVKNDEPVLPGGFGGSRVPLLKVPGVHQTSLEHCLAYAIRDCIDEMALFPEERSFVGCRQLVPLVGNRDTAELLTLHEDGSSLDPSGFVEPGHAKSLVPKFDFCLAVFGILPACGNGFRDQAEKVGEGLVRLEDLIN